MVTFTAMKPGLITAIEAILRSIPNDGISMRIDNRLVEFTSTRTNFIYRGWVDSRNRIRISIQSMTNHCEATLVLDRDSNMAVKAVWVDVYTESGPVNSNWIIAEAQCIVDTLDDIFQFEDSKSLMKHLVAMLYRSQRYQEPMSQPVSGG